jgi:hypothetical protein
MIKKLLNVTEYCSQRGLSVGLSNEFFMSDGFIFVLSRDAMFEDLSNKFILAFRATRTQNAWRRNF